MTVRNVWLLLLLVTFYSGFVAGMWMYETGKIKPTSPHVQDTFRVAEQAMRQTARQHNSSWLSPLSRGWELLALLILGTIALQWAVQTVAPLVPFVVGFGIAIAISTIIYRWMRRW